MKKNEYPARVLLVDDTPKNLQLLGNILKEYEYKIYAANNGKQALETAQETLPDIILLDVMMPDIDGYETCRRLKESRKTKDIPVIFLTAKTDIIDMVKGFELGAVDYITKPFNKVELLTRVNAHLEIKFSKDLLKQANEKIERQNKELQEQYKVIEERVEERTRELKLSNIKLSKEIKERTEAQKELSRLAAAINQAEEAIVITDRDAIIQYVNPAFERITGYKREEAIGQNPRMLQGGKHDKSFYKELWNTLLSGKTWKGQFINKKKIGEIYSEDASITPVLDSSGNISNYVAVKRDITKHLQFQRQIRQSQKMDAMGKLAGGIAHDFNNILTGIIGYTEIAADDLPEESEARHSLEEVLKAGNRAKDLVKQILTFSRKTEHEFKPIQLHHLIKEPLTLLRASLPATIEIRSNIEGLSDTILGDSTQITQIVMNLCTNAQHAMGQKGGILVVNLEPVEVDEEFATIYKDLKAGPYAMLTISDTGSGMDKKTMDHIFEPFFTTKPKGEGTGMGLSVVHGIVASHGGMMTVYSEIGEGTTFHIYLPITGTERVEKEKIADIIPGGNERILFVDDEESIVLMGKKMLEKLGYKVVSTTNAKIALDIFSKTPEKFDIVLTDMTMPGITGVELARELIKIRKDIPIVLCSGHGSFFNEEEANEIGIKKAINKPFMKQNLAETIRKLLD